MTTPADVVARIRQLGIPGYGDDEVAFMAETVLDAQPDVVFDWGTNRGSSARIFYETVHAACWPARVVTIDLPDGNAHPDFPGVDLGFFVRRLPVEILRGDGAEVATGMARPSEATVFFVDGDHSEATVRRELALIRDRVPGATVLLHDARLDGPRAGARVLLADQRYRATWLWSNAGMVRLVPA